MAFRLGSGAFNLPAASTRAMQPNAEQIGAALFQRYMLPFEIASILLLVAMIGAVVMAKRKI
jgi:NADH-quinone oxidoreductase subunit J